MALGVGRRSAGGLGVLAAVALLAACSGGGGAGALAAADADDDVADRVSSNRGTERPEVEKPTPPDAMRRDDVAGAEAAAQYFLQLYPYVYATGDLAEWKAMSHPECVFCEGSLERADDVYGSGGQSAVGGLIEFGRFSSHPRTRRALSRLDMTRSEDASSTTSTDGGDNAEHSWRDVDRCSLSRKRCRRSGSCEASRWRSEEFDG